MYIGCTDVSPGDLLAMHALAVGALRETPVTWIVVAARGEDGEGAGDPGFSIKRQLIGMMEFPVSWRYEDNTLAMDGVTHARVFAGAGTNPTARIVYIELGHVDALYGAWAAAGGFSDQMRMLLGRTRRYGMGPVPTHSVISPGVDAFRADMSSSLREDVYISSEGILSDTFSDRRLFAAAGLDFMNPQTMPGGRLSPAQTVMSIARRCSLLRLQRDSRRINAFTVTLERAISRHVADQDAAAIVRTTADLSREYEEIVDGPIGGLDAPQGGPLAISLEALLVVLCVQKHEVRDASYLATGTPSWFFDDCCVVREVSSSTAASFLFAARRSTTFAARLWGDVGPDMGTAMLQRDLAALIGPRGARV